jgi:hypothetical protein
VSGAPESIRAESTTQAKPDAPAQISVQARADGLHLQDASSGSRDVQLRYVEPRGTYGVTGRVVGLSTVIGIDVDRQMLAASTARE